MIKMLMLICLTFSLNAKNECDGKEFSRFSISRQATIYNALEQLSNSCSLSIIIKDEDARAIMDKKSGVVNLKKFTLEHALAVLLGENNLNYELDDNLLRISYLDTKSFRVDYVATSRNANSGIQTSVTAQNQLFQQSQQMTQTASQFPVGTNISTSDTFDFWTQIEDELRLIMSQSPVVQSNIMESITTTSDKAQNKTIQTKPTLVGGVVVNKNANLITITGTKEEIDRVEKYLKLLMTRLHKQVLIDVNIYSVSLDDLRTTGVDWSNLFNFLNATVSLDGVRSKNVSAFDASSLASSDKNVKFVGSDFFRISANITLKDIVKFLDTQGKVKSISNPKVLTLNNQPALIFSGETIYYPVVSGGTSASAVSGATNPSVVATPLPVGVTLDITPEIIDDEFVILKINPSASSCISAACELQRVSIGGQNYDIAPNVSQKQLSSVIKVKNGEKIVLGGLIRDKNENKSVKIPLLGDIPLFGYMFKQDSVVKSAEELVVIITPHITDTAQYAKNSSENIVE